SKPTGSRIPPDKTRRDVESPRPLQAVGGTVHDHLRSNTPPTREVGCVFPIRRTNQGHCLQATRRFSREGEAPAEPKQSEGPQSAARLRRSVALPITASLRMSICSEGQVATA